MFLRLFMILMKPSDGLLRKRVRGRLADIRVKWYQSILRGLLKTYSHYAISDMIVVSEDMQIIHEYRDPEFERELQRNRIDFRLKMQVSSLPLKAYKSTRRNHLGYFDFTSTLKLTADGKEWIIKHDDAVAVEGSVKSKVKCTAGLYGLQQVVLDIKSALSKGKAQSSKTVFHKEEEQKVAPPRKPVKRTSVGLFANEKDIPSIKTVEPEAEMMPELPEVPPEVIAKKGFDIDSSF